MTSVRRSSLSIAALGAVLLAACESVDIDENDRDAYVLEGRIRKELKRSEKGTSTYVEAGWTSLRGESERLDYGIDTLTLGGGLDMHPSERARVDISSGFAWQLYDLEVTPLDIDDHNAFGIYLAIEAGWLLLAWLEPYARIGGAGFVDEFASSSFGEIGLKFHAGEHAALYAGWRYTRHDVEDIEHGLTLNTVELDASGAIVGLLLSF